MNYKLTVLAKIAAVTCIGTLVACSPENHPTGVTDAAVGELEVATLRTEVGAVSIEDIEIGDRFPPRCGHGDSHCWLAPQGLSVLTVWMDPEAADVDTLSAMLESTESVFVRNDEGSNSDLLTSGMQGSTPFMAFVVPATASSFSLYWPDNLPLGLLLDEEDFNAIERAEETMRKRRFFIAGRDGLSREIEWNFKVISEAQLMIHSNKHMEFSTPQGGDINAGKYRFALFLASRGKPTVTVEAVLNPGTEEIILASAEFEVVSSQFRLFESTVDGVNPEADEGILSLRISTRGPSAALLVRNGTVPFVEVP